MLQYCNVVVLQCCIVEMLQFCDVVMFQCCNNAMLQSCKVAMLQCYTIAMMQCCNITTLPCCYVENIKIYLKTQVGYRRTDIWTYEETGGLLELLSQLKKRMCQWDSPLGWCGKSLKIWTKLTTHSKHKFLLFFVYLFLQ